MTGLSPELVRLLQEARTAHDPSPGDEARVLKAVYAATGAMAATSLAAGTAQAASAGTLNASTAATGGVTVGKVSGAMVVAGKAGVLGASLTAKVVGGAVLVASAGSGYALLQRADPAYAPPAERVAAPDAPRPGHVSQAPSAAPESPALTPSVTPMLAQPSPAVVPSQPPATEHPSTVRSESHHGQRAHGLPSLADELTLLRRAQTAMRDGDPLRALSLLHQHAVRFPAGALRDERLGAVVLATCASGKLDAGRALRAAFLRESPDSPLAARVRSACEAGSK
ncbi:MAG: hypothetical protein RL385_1255 [Pseudomonadota bacterium]|jgi:hypothetical protein